MNKELLDRELYLGNLGEAVAQAVSLFQVIDAAFFDGFQTAHEVLAHLVFWHREYVQVSQALLLKTNPQLRKASLARLNKLAGDEYRDFSMEALCLCYIDLQANLLANLRRLTDWEVNFPYKKGCRQANVVERLAAIETHINFHTARLQRVQRRGEAWVDAYYREHSS